MRIGQKRHDDTIVTYLTLLSLLLSWIAMVLSVSIIVKTLIKMMVKKQSDGRM